jgi:hypothetical protein
MLTNCRNISHFLVVGQTSSVKMVSMEVQIPLHLHPLTSFFDTCQVSLGPLMLATKFVLVGDHYQLPPLVQVSTNLRMYPIFLFQSLLFGFKCFLF